MKGVFPGSPLLSAHPTEGYGESSPRPEGPWASTHLSFQEIQKTPTIPGLLLKSLCCSQAWGEGERGRAEDRAKAETPTPTPSSQISSETARWPPRAGGLLLRGRGRKLLRLRAPARHSSGLDGPGGSEARTRAAAT